MDDGGRGGEVGAASASAPVTSAEFKVGRASPSEVEERGEREAAAPGPLTTPDFCASLCVETCRFKLQKKTTPT